MMYICRMNLAIEDIAPLVRVTFILITGFSFITFFHLSFVEDCAQFLSYMKMPSNYY